MPVRRDEKVKIHAPLMSRCSSSRVPPVNPAPLSVPNVSLPTSSQPLLHPLSERVWRVCQLSPGRVRVKLLGRAPWPTRQQLARKR